MAKFLVSILTDTGTSIAPPNTKIRASGYLKDPSEKPSPFATNQLARVNGFNRETKETATTSIHRRYAASRGDDETREKKRGERKGKKGGERKIKQEKRGEGDRSFRRMETVVGAGTFVKLPAGKDGLTVAEPSIGTRSWRVLLHGGFSTGLLSLLV